MKDLIKAFWVLSCIFGACAGIYLLLQRSGMLKRNYMIIEED